jgi:hypothetical protein
MIGSDPVERCCDGGECYFVQRGLPRCKGTCSIWEARFSAKWNKIKRAAQQDVEAASDILTRGSRFGRHRTSGKGTWPLRRSP